jgi:hypothetical protein
MYSFQPYYDVHKISLSYLYDYAFDAIFETAFESTFILNFFFKLDLNLSSLVIF